MSEDDLLSRDQDSSNVPEVRDGQFLLESDRGESGLCAFAGSWDSRRVIWRGNLSGAETIAMEWTLTNAMRGIRLQVSKENLERAQACLAEAQTQGSGELEDLDSSEQDGPLPENEELADQEIQAREDDFHPNRREETANRALRAAILGCAIFPLQIYVTFLLMQVFLANDVLRPNARKRAWWAFWINLPFVLGFLWYLRSMS